MFSDCKFGWKVALRPGPPSRKSASAKAVNADGGLTEDKHQRSHIQQEEPDRQAELWRIVACAHVCVERTDEEADEADRGSRPDPWHADEAEQQPDRASGLQGANW